MVGLSPAGAPVAYFFCPLILPISSYPCVSCQKWTLYVESLSPRVTEYMLTEIFAVVGPVRHVMIIRDSYIDHRGLNYSFVEYMDMRAAETALQVLNGRKIFDTEIRVNRAYQGQQNKEDTPNHFNVFIGDLPPEVNDTVLAQVFTAFGSLYDARVMWDMNSGKSRGYGFVAFRDKTDAEQAIALMNGERLGSRVIRVTWADQKTQGGPSSSSSGLPMRSGGTAPARTNFLGGPLIYERVVWQTHRDNTTVRVGNLVPYCTQADLIPLFPSIGYLSEIRMHADRGFAFVKFDTHEHAAMAIVELHGHMVHGRPITCSWRMERPDAGSPMSGSPTNFSGGPPPLLRDSRAADGPGQHYSLRWQPRPLLHSGGPDPSLPIHWIPF